jgi:hypothetical protein
MTAADIKGAVGHMAEDAAVDGGIAFAAASLYAFGSQSEDDARSPYSYAVKSFVHHPV